jgi:hypothetical protein
MKLGTRVGFGSRRSFHRRAYRGIAGGLLASGISPRRPWAEESDEASDSYSLRIVKVEPHLLTGVRGYAP